MRVLLLIDNYTSPPYLSEGKCQHLHIPPGSKVWLYFSRTDPTSVQCNISKKIIISKAGNTTNLMKHLNVHRINLQVKVLPCLNARRPNSIHLPRNIQTRVASLSATGLHFIQYGRWHSIWDFNR